MNQHTKAHKAKIENSCGCVFCDIGLEPTMIEGRPHHYTKQRGYLLCEHYMAAQQAKK